MQTFDRSTSYPYGTSAGKVYKTELLEYKKRLGLVNILTKIKQDIVQNGHIFPIIHV